MARYLLIRLSAMGDVAMTIPTLYALANSRPQDQFTLLTQPFLTALLIDPPSNLDAMAIDIRREERGLWGLVRYAHRLCEEQFDAVIDLHDVLRTKILRAYLATQGVRCYSIHKPRKQRRVLLTACREHLIDVTPMPSLHRQVLEQAGLSFSLEIAPLKLGDEYSINLYNSYPEFRPQFGLRSIGIAPFASTPAKTYDLSLMEQVVQLLSESGLYSIYLLGARGKEAQHLDQWAEKYAHCISVAGRLDLSQELILLSRLECVVSMDSANMHMASMLGVRVVSIWCATHPAAGFLGLGQSGDDCLVARRALDCSPCSIFGQVKSCPRGDFLCRRVITPQNIVELIQKQTNHPR